MNDSACVWAVDPEKGQLGVGQWSGDGWLALGHWINCFALLRINWVALWHKIFLLLFSDLSRSVYDIFNRRQRQQSHWASGVEFLGADSDFGAVAEFEAVGEAGGGVDVDYSCIDFVQEFLGVGVVVGDDCFGVFCRYRYQR